MINLRIENYLRSQYPIFADPKFNVNLSNGAFQTETRRTSSSIVNPRSTFAHFYLRQIAWQKKQYLKRKSEPFSAKPRNTPTCFPTLKILYLVVTCLYIHVKLKKNTPLWCEYCRFDCFETRLGKPLLILYDLNGSQNIKKVCSIHLELLSALPYQIRAGKWKFVNQCLDFLCIPDQRTAYGKRKARPGRTSVRRSIVTQLGYGV